MSGKYWVELAHIQSYETGISNTGCSFSFHYQSKFNGWPKNDQLVCDFAGFHNMAAQQQCRASNEYTDSPNRPAYNGPSTCDDAGATSRRLADPAPSTNLCAGF